MYQALFMFLIQFMNTPTFSQKADGSYIEIVKTGYDSNTNKTYAVLEVYQVHYTTPHLYWMQVRPFDGQPSTQAILQSLVHDDSVTTVGLNK